MPTMSRVRSVLSVVAVQLAIVIPTLASAGGPPPGTVVIDVVPGTSVRGFALLWTFGDGEIVRGLATDTAGNVYLTWDGQLYSMDATTGAVNWTYACAGGCRSVALDGTGVYTAWGNTPGIVKLDHDGDWVCDFDSGVAPSTLGDIEIVVAGDYVVVQTTMNPNIGEPGRLIVLDTDCNLRYEVPAPLDRRGNGNPIVDLPGNKLVSYWGDPDATLNTSLVYTEAYDLDTGNLRCWTHSGAFRQAMVGELVWHGVGATYIDNTATDLPGEHCSFTGNQVIGAVNGVPTGDLRDMAYADGFFYLLSNPYGNSWPSGGHPGRLLKIDLADYGIEWMSTDFGVEADPIANVNKMGIANRWAVVTHGRNGSANAHTWMATIVDLDDGSTVTRFGRTLIHRLTHERLIDGGLFLHTSQYGNVINPDTPLLVWKLGTGSFVGHAYRYGDALGNKYCGPACLAALEGVVVGCTPLAADSSFSCDVQNLYQEPVDTIRFATLPSGEVYEVYDSFGAQIGAGTGEIQTTLPLGPGESRTVHFLTDAGSADPGSLLDQITVGKSMSSPGALTIGWSAACAVGATDYAIYEGSLPDFTSHEVVTCTDSGGDLTEEITPAAGSTYYLVVPRNESFEGSYGTDSAGNPRSPAASPCVAAKLPGICP